MNGYDAYRQAAQLPATRIDVILELYRVALDNLARAQQVLSRDGYPAARPLVLKSQMAIMGLAAELPAYKDNELAVNFLRFYEFASAQMIQGTSAGMEAAAKVLRTLFEAFVKVRDEAAALERSNRIPPLDRANLLSFQA